MIRLSEEMRIILKEVVEKRRPDLRRVLPYIEKLEPFDNEDVTAICSELYDEICETGLDENRESNRRGKILYRLIRCVNQLLKD